MPNFHPERLRRRQTEGKRNKTGSIDYQQIDCNPGQSPAAFGAEISVGRLAASADQHDWRKGLENLILPLDRSLAGSVKSCTLFDISESGCCHPIK